MADEFQARLKERWHRATVVLSGPENLFMIVMGGIVGVAGGYGAIVFRKLITFFTALGWGTLTGLHNAELLTLALAAPIWVKILVPAAGGLVVGFLVYFIAQEAKGHGVPEVMEAVALRDGRMRTRLIAIKTLASAVCIGTGGSVGREGPIVQIGSAIGSSLGQLLHVSGARLRTLVACGAAAGIAATFNAPMAGIIFSLEVILPEFAASQFIPIAVSSVMATAVSRHYLGNYPAFEIPTYALVNYTELLFYLFLGVLSGFVAYAFIRSLFTMEGLWDRLKMPLYVKAVIGGTLVGCIGIFTPNIFGVGYETVTQVLLEQTLGGILVVFLVAKILATSISIGSGGSGGIFAPSLFMGATLGGAFGNVVHSYFPQMTATPGAYALVGMGAVVAGTTRAPIAAILIIFEMSGDYHIILPLMFACTIGLVVSALLSPESIYTMKLVRRGVDIYKSRGLNILRTLKVSEVMRPGVEAMDDSTDLREIIHRMKESTHSHFFMVGKDGRVVGHIRLETLRPILWDYEAMGSLVIASDVMDRHVTVVKPSETLDFAMQLLGRFDLDEIPVVEEGKLVGTVRRLDVIEAYNREIGKLDTASGLAASFKLHQKTRIERMAALGEFLVLETVVPPEFCNKTLEELHLRRHYGATVLVIKRWGSEAGSKPSYILPTATTRVVEGDILIVFGLQREIARFPHSKKK
jgi:CIC family chloride channel protein